MSRVEAAGIVFGLLFIIIFIIDYFFINRKYLRKSKKNKKARELTEISYLVSKFNLDKDKLNMNKLTIIIAIINAFIIALVSVLVMLIKVFIVLQLLIGFILLIALIYSIYERLGRTLVKKGYEKDGKENYRKEMAKILARTQYF